MYFLGTKFCFSGVLIWALSRQLTWLDSSCQTVSWAAAHILLFSLSHSCMVQGFTTGLGKVYTQNLGLLRSFPLVSRISSNIQRIQLLPVLWFFRLRAKEPGNSASASQSPLPSNCSLPKPTSFHLLSMAFQQLVFCICLRFMIAIPGRIRPVVYPAFQN